jgi:hypothetical protein
MTASAPQNVPASERHHVRKAERVTTGEHFRNANNSIAAQVQSGWTYGGYSVPAGR